MVDYSSSSSIQAVYLEIIIIEEERLGLHCALFVCFLFYIQAGLTLAQESVVCSLT